MRILPLLLIAAVLQFPVVLFPPNAIAGCDDETREQALHDRSWIKSDKTIYVAEDGKIFERQFNGETMTQLADHGFGRISDFELSRDGRFILYSGSHAGVSDYYVYDTKTREDYRLPTNGYASIRFSPDGERLAWVAGTTVEPAETFEIMNLMDHSLISVAYPEEARTLHDYRTTEPRWSLDGKEVYLATLAYPTGAYFRYNLQEKKISRIDGRFQPWNNDGRNEGYGIHFIEEGKELPFHRPPCIQWQCVEGGTPMKGATAVVNSDYELIVKTPDGHEATVDQGEYNECEGVTIGILSWVENGRYLVYEVHQKAFVYGVLEKKKAALFDSPEIVPFGWADPENYKTSAMD
jgi:hypothetical protein